MFSCETVPLNISDISFSKDVVAGKPALRLNWTTPDSERSIIRYQIAYRQIERYIWMTTFSSPISLNLENLSAGTRYEIRIRANSDVGFGSYGETITLETYSGNIIMHFNYPQHFTMSSRSGHFLYKESILLR